MRLPVLAGGSVYSRSMERERDGVPGPNDCPE